MTLRLRSKILTAAIGGAALVLSGCGSSGDSGASSSKLHLAHPGELTCAMSGEYRPFNFYGPDTKLEGFDVDMCSAIAKELGVKPNPVTGQFDSLIGGLGAGRYDAIIGSMAKTPERAKQVDFSQPYYSTGTQLFVQPDSSAESIQDLKDATVGVALGTTFEQYARQQPNIKDVKTYKADINALQDLAAGRLDGVITQSLMGRYLIKNADLEVKAIGGILAPDVASIPVRKGNSELLAAIDKALATIKSDGTYSSISDKWFGGDVSELSSATPSS